MAKKNRFPMQVSPEFKARLDEIQKKIMMAKGEKKSLRDITTDIIKSSFFNDIEANMIKQQNNLKFDVKIKFDKRLLR